ncbi:hypothetical protein WJX72_004079 [[Myrmecia] bisecta]|uniref:Exocyst complex component Sec10 n=1 Tax=[Myrmecia] bisecta TaxID=41462 RepID=A0AAW1QQ36_9CHLO
MSAQPLVQLDTFKGEHFKVSDLVSTLSQQVLDQHVHNKAKAAPPSKAAAPRTVQQTASVDSLALLDQLLAQFERAEKEMSKLQAEVDQRVDVLQREVADEEENFQMQVEILEAGLEETQQSFQELDGQMGHVGQASTRIGDRLQSSEGFRKRAIEAIKVIQYMQEFAEITDFSQLSELFQDDDRLAEAAAMTRQILVLGLELTSAKERVGLGDEQQARHSGTSAHKGTIEHAVQQLEAYRNVLENRVVSHFDAAVSQGDLGIMAECARIMAEFKRGEMSLVQRYISTRAMFIDVKELAFGGGGKVTDTSSAITAMRALNALYKSILQTVKDEAVIMEQVFPSPGAALALLVQRVFEQRVQSALDRMLEAPMASGAPEAVQQYLKLLAEAYKRTVTLADNLQEVVGDAANVSEYTDVVFSEALGDYPRLELQWLQQLYESKAAQSHGMSIETVAQYFLWNHEAVERCCVLSPAASCASNVRQLFHSSTVDRASTGCLLEQVASHVTGGLAAGLEACTRASAAPYTVAVAGSTLRSAISKAAFTVTQEGLGKVLEAIGVATAIIKLLQQHYTKSIEPAVDDVLAESVSCSTGMAALIRAVEERVLATLQSALNAFFAQVDRTLASEQKRIDFRPPEDLPPPLDRPTDACLLVTALLTVLMRTAQQNLQASNLVAFNAEVGRRTHALILAHMQRYSYSPTGALRWKCDVTEYAECMRAMHIPAIDERFEEVAALTNMLVVAPDSLLGLVDGSLRISHQQALKYIKLREDFKTARVDEGLSLAVMFASD